MAQLKCSYCQEFKEEGLFPKANGKARGYAWVCKVCKKERRLSKQNSMTEQEWKLQNRRYWLKCSYNITLEEYNNKLIDQNHRCAICNSDETQVYMQKLFVDHCHKTNKIRGLLCQACNIALGNLKDSVTILNSAIAYVEKHK
jgi:hypothetical protein